MATITWKVDSIDVKPEDGELTDVVYTVCWRVYAEELDTSVSNYGVTTIPAPEEESFIPFEELDEEIVVEWVHSVMGEETVESIEDAVEAELIAILIPAVVSKPLPWL